MMIYFVNQNSNGAHTALGYPNEYIARTATPAVANGIYKVLVSASPAAPVDSPNPIK